MRNMLNGGQGEEMKSSRPAACMDYDSDDSDHGRSGTANKVKRKRLGRDYVKNAFTINTSYCRTELETIQHII